MKTLKSSVFISTLAAFVLTFGSGCSSNKFDMKAKHGTDSHFDLNDSRARNLGSYQGSSTGMRILFFGGSPSEIDAQKRMKMLAKADALKQGVDPATLRFVNDNESVSSVPLLIVNFKTVNYMADAYYLKDDGQNRPPASLTGASYR